MKGGGHLPLKPQNRRPSFASKPLVKTNPSNAPTRGHLFARRGVFCGKPCARQRFSVFREYYISFPRRTGNYLPETAPMNRRIGFVFSERCLTSAQRLRRTGSRSTPSLDTECAFSALHGASSAEAGRIVPRFCLKTGCGRRAFGGTGAWPDRPLAGSEHGIKSAKRNLKKVFCPIDKRGKRCYSIPVVSTHQ